MTKLRWTLRVGWLLAALGVFAGACSDPEPDPVNAACEKKCSEQEACCPLGGCAEPRCVPDCVEQTQAERANCRAEIDEYVSCSRSAKTWSCEQAPGAPLGITAIPDGCDDFPVICCINRNSATPQVIAGCPVL